MTQQPLPALMSVAQIAKAVGWSTRRTRRVLKNANALVKIDGRWLTSKGRLRTTIPEFSEALEAFDLANEQDDEWEP